jgi:hypothetical protein
VAGWRLDLMNRRDTESTERAYSRGAEKAGHSCFAASELLTSAFSSGRQDFLRNRWVVGERLRWETPPHPPSAPSPPLKSAGAKALGETSCRQFQAACEKRRTTTAFLTHESSLSPLRFVESLLLPRFFAGGEGAEGG